MQKQLYKFNSGLPIVIMTLALIILWPGLLKNLLASSGFMPHGHCYLWKPELVSLHLASDLLIGLSYVAISATLAYLVNKARQDIPFDWMFLAFGLFIISCGITHFVEVWTLWTPTYWLAGEIKLITAVASVTTAIALPPLVPQVLSLIASARLSQERKLNLEIANQELEQLYAKLKEVDQLKTQFFATVSHELRTPLTLILGQTESIITEQQLDEKQQQKLEVVRTNAHSLLKHVNDLLDISKLEAQKMEINYVQVDLVPLVRLTAANFDSIAQQKQINLAVDTPESLLTQVDPEKLQRVLLNLLANAFKFTPMGGSISCILRLEEIEQQESIHASAFSITVADSGNGVAPELREVIFEPFRQGEAGSNRRYGGTGLGLAIAKEFVELHNGTIKISDAPQGGASFNFQIPLIATFAAKIEDAVVTLNNTEAIASQLLQELQANQELTSSAPSASSAPLVLVIEDHPEMRNYIAQILESDYSIVTANNGQDGLQKAIALRPDLIVSDVMMPQMSGEQLLEQINQHSELDGIPIVFLTAKADDETRLQLLRQGAQDYLTKPFKAEELRVRISNLLTMKGVRQVLQRELDSKNQDLETLAKELATRKQELQKLAAELEFKVEERTAELALSNSFLRREITARQIAQEELEHSLSVLGATLESTADGILVINLTGKIVSYNQKFLELWHIPEAVIASQNDSELVTFVLEQLKDPENFLKSVENVYQQIDAETYDIFEFKDGRIFERYSLPQRIGGECVGKVLSFRDLTKRQQAEAELRNSESTLRSFYNSAAMMMGVVELLDNDIRHIYDNSAAAEFFGLTPEITQNRLASEMGVPPEHLRRWINYYQTAAATQAPVKFDYIHETSEGRKWLAATVCAINATPVSRNEGSLSLTSNQQLTNNHSRFAYIVEDITSQKQAEERLRLLESVVVHANDAIVITEAEPINLPGPRIIYVNDAFTQMTGYSEQEVIGQTPRILQGQNSDRATLAKIRAAMEKWQPTLVELMNYRKDGSEYWVELSLVPIADATGWYTHWIAIERDITERRQAEQEIRLLNTELEQRVTQRTAQLEAANLELDRANRMKDEFLAIVSHELRTPLNAILGWANLLRTRNFDLVTTNKALETIERNAKSQTQLIDDLLDVSQMMRGKFHLHLGTVDLAVIIQAAIESALPTAQTKSIDLQFTIQDNESLVDKERETHGHKDISFVSTSSASALLSPCPNHQTLLPNFIVTGDANRLQQVVWNLLSNAIKFTPEGGKVEVKLSLVCGIRDVEGLRDKEAEGVRKWGSEGVGKEKRDKGEERDKEELKIPQSTVTSQQSTVISHQSSVTSHQSPIRCYARVQITDTGCGISAEFLPFVFEQFRQADASITRAHGGLGLGLAIVRQVVQLHGGNVSADSAGKGRGATFTVELPLMQASAYELKPGEKQSFLSPLASHLQPLKDLQVMVVDDEVHTTDSLITALEKYGAQVTGVASVPNALAMLEKVAPNVLISNMTMPGDNYSLIRQIRGCNIENIKHIPAVALLTNSGDAERSCAIAAGFQKCVAKPVQPSQLVAVITMLTGRIKKL